MGADDGVGRMEMNEGGAYFSSGFRAIGEGVDLRVPVRRLKGEDPVWVEVLCFGSEVQWVRESHKVANRGCSDHGFQSEARSSMWRGGRPQVRPGGESHSLVAE